MTEGVKSAIRYTLYAIRSLIVCSILYALCSFSICFAQPTPTEINLYINETKVVPGENIAEYFVTNPVIADATKTTPYSLEIKGLIEGQTFVNLWDDEGRKTVKVIVSRTPTEKAKKLEVGRTYETVKGSYTYTWQNTNYTGTTNSQIWNSIHYLTLNGDTPLGPINTNLGYEDRNQVLGVSQLSLSVKRDKYQLTLGDSSINFSELTLPYVGLQGAKLTSYHIPNLETNFLYGVAGYGWWGVTSRTFLGETRNLAGFNTTYKYDPNTTVKSSYVHVNDKENAPLDNVYGTEISKSLGDWTLDLEAAKNNNDSSWKLDANYENEKFNFQSTFRNVGQDFQSASGGVSYPGVSGLFTSASFNPVNYLKLSSRLETYKNRLYTNTANPEYQNLYFSGNVDFDLTPFPHLNAQYFYDDKQGYTGVGVFEGRSFELSKGFNLRFPLSLYLRYYPTRYSNPSDADQSEDYVNNSTSLGATLSVTDYLSLNLEKGWTARTGVPVLNPNTGEFEYPNNYDSDFTNYGLNFTPGAGFKLFENSDFSAYATTNWRMEPRSDTIENGVRQNYGRSTLSADLTFDYHPYSTGRFYLTMRAIDTKGLIDQSLNLQEMDFTFGINQNFDSGFLWVPKGKVVGYVFNDLNANGIRDENEKGITNAKVTLNSKTYITNEYGRFWFAGIPGGDVNIALDQTTVPEKFSVTTANPQSFAIGYGESKEINFGIGQRTILEGFVYNDVNLNKAYDPGIDAGLKGMKVIFDEKVKYTDPRGKYIIEQVSPGSHKIALDVQSLPFEFLPFTPSSNSFAFIKGDQKQQDFGLKIQRLVTGFVYEDANKNQMKDKGEKVFTGIKVLLKDQESEVDRDGRYLFKDLPAGTFSLNIDEASLPAGYLSSISLPQEITLNETGDNKKQIDIILSRGKKTAPSGLEKSKIAAWARPYNLFHGEKIDIIVSIPIAAKDIKIAVYNSDTKQIKTKKVWKDNTWQVWKGQYQPPRKLPLGKHLLKIYVKSKNMGFDPVYLDYYIHEREVKEKVKVEGEKVKPSAAEAAGVIEEEAITIPPAEKLAPQIVPSKKADLKIEVEGIEKVDENIYNLKLRLKVLIDKEMVKKMISESKVKMEVEGIEKVSEDQYNLKVRLNVPLDKKLLEKMLKESE